MLRKRLSADMISESEVDVSPADVSFNYSDMALSILLFPSEFTLAFFTAFRLCRHNGHPEQESERFQRFDMVGDELDDG